MTTGRPYAGRTPEERRAARRRALLDAALELYGTVGYRETSLARLCRHAKVAPVKFYEEFPSQEALLIAVCQEVLRDEEDAVLAALAGAPQDAEARLRASLDAYCHTLLDDERRARVLCIEYPGASLAAEATRREHIVRFAQLTLGEMRLFIPGIERAGLRDDQLVLAATTLVGGVHEAVLQWLFAADRPSIDDLVDTLTLVFWSAKTYLEALAEGATDLAVEQSPDGWIRASARLRS